MKRVAIVSSILFLATLVGVFSFPDFMDMIDGRLYQASLVFERAQKLLPVAASYEAIVLNPSLKHVGINEGLRKEEIADLCQQKLNWSDTDAALFSNSLSCTTESDEGYFLPGVYTVESSSTPREIKEAMTVRSDASIRQLIVDAGSDPDKVDIDTVVKVASLIQREAAGKRDMNLISGIIWNRLAENMPLQVDSTLQYIKGKDGRWWPAVRPKDKYLDSPYNTYQNEGLPPTAISNPGLAAIAAALNPEKTNYFYYLHDAYGRIHCAETYDEHKANIEKYLK